MTPEQAIARLRSFGRGVERCDFPPAPLPGLYNIEPHYRDVTERQLISLAETLGPLSRD